ncbi:hypothetical protein OGAPHI_005849 [Ogataea philodendri]|uniref:Uncharacterized protein n=1 Tax=Ogataea philodendri TaxID=1378263 RepID=A0A9P8NZT5_9ASCO|nr:uncharacterized protein OGAPHI_005849 [Ogataea philodendri]KAH3662597.1 hypothetical protein OGAPHI_005849 [Ogataea philodendri]
MVLCLDGFLNVPAASPNSSAPGRGDSDGQNSCSIRRNKPRPIGLDRNPDIPALRQSSLLLWSANAVRATIGPVYLSSSLITRVAESPSMFGIWTSIKTRSYVSLLAWASFIRRMASDPSHASVVSVIPSSLNIRLITSWLTRLSSAIRNRSEQEPVDATPEELDDVPELVDDFRFECAVPVEALVIRSGFWKYEISFSLVLLNASSSAKLTFLILSSSGSNSPT